MKKNMRVRVKIIREIVLRLCNRDAGLKRTQIYTRVRLELPHWITPAQHDEINYAVRSLYLDGRLERLPMGYYRTRKEKLIETV